jgi:hypothetical protein
MNLCSYFCSVKQGESGINCNIYFNHFKNNIFMYKVRFFFIINCQSVVRLAENSKQ